MTPQQIHDSWKENVAPSQACSPQDMAKRVARWGHIPASPRAFVDTYVQGHERTLYSVIGSGVTDNPDFKPSIAAAENFHVDYIVAPKGCGAAMHWHDSEEVFVVQAGRWEFDWIDGASWNTSRHCGKAFRSDAKSHYPKPSADRQMALVWRRTQIDDAF